MGVKTNIIVDWNSFPQDKVNVFENCRDHAFAPILKSIEDLSQDDMLKTLFSRLFNSFVIHNASNKHIENKGKNKKYIKI